MASPPADKRNTRFAGLGFRGTFALAAALPAIAAFFTFVALDSIAQKEDPWSQLEERARAAGTALGAITKLEAERRDLHRALSEERRAATRARAEAAALARSPRPSSEIDLVATIDLARDRVI